MKREALKGLLHRYWAKPLAILLDKAGLSANAITVLGLFISFGAAYLLSRGWFMSGGIVLLIAAAFDLLDGTLARMQDQASRFGAFLDSVSDRLSEAAIFLGLLIFYSLEHNVTGSILVSLALIFSFMVSYLRARAEGLQIDSSVGLATRPERVIILGIGVILGFVIPTLALIAALSLFTSIQRFHHVWKASQT
jgi:CDP-diacylglycerol--glycerol-3-phosphate 3-phosphatidyltransferase